MSIRMLVAAGTFFVGVGCIAQESIGLPRSFPQSDYAPFGYIDNPYHSAVLNRSGIIRSVPPLGFGYWARRLPWPYGEGALRRLNYLSFVHLSFNIGGATFHKAEDFSKNGVELTSRYHTKTVMSYDWEYHGVQISARYFLAAENSIVCLLELRNKSSEPKSLIVHATNIYGWPEERWWGSDGVVSRRASGVDAAISKIWAYGDVFAIGADRSSTAYKATASQGEWDQWIRSADLSSNAGASMSFPGAIYALQSYSLEVPAGRAGTLTIALTRGVNEDATLRTHREALSNARVRFAKQLANDEAFYASAPVLSGDWPPVWKHGWIYDLETLRMTIRPPLGIYEAPWDGMQIHTPRQVLGETMFDAMALSYADIDLVKKVILGTFANAKAGNVPCSREDGSVNMICADGSEGATNPTWGYPFLVIHSIWLRDGDDYWIRSLYPHLKRYIEWWLKNRTDKDGYFFVKCSWEAQDASARFPLGNGAHAGAVADFVRMVDIEAAMAHAMQTMAKLAVVAGYPEDRGYWDSMAAKRLDTTRSMFVDGWFRDWDNRSNMPIFVKDYWDIMMLAPLTTNVATPEQAKALQPRFQYYKEHPLFWLEWPSFMFHFTEAAWNAGLRLFNAGVIVDTGDRIYPRIDGRTLRPLGGFKTTLPEQYAFRIRGVSDEFWPIQEDNPGGCENYGWGATLPTLIIRNVFGFRESANAPGREFVLAPALPPQIAIPGKRYGIKNLRFRSVRTTLEYNVLEGGELAVRMDLKLDRPVRVAVRDDAGNVLAGLDSRTVAGSLQFRARNGSIYTMQVD